MQAINRLLPIDKDSKLKGISGSSAGAITAFLLSIGMTAEEIEDVSKPENGATEFEKFIDDNPIPCLYSGVHYSPKRKMNESSYCVDYIAVGPSRVRIPRGYEIDLGKYPYSSFVPPYEVEVEKAVLQKTSAMFIPRQRIDSKPKEEEPKKSSQYNKAITEATNAYRKIRKNKGKGFLSFVAWFMAKPKRLRKKMGGPYDFLIDKIATRGNREKTNKYVFSLLFDRGLATGIPQRDFLYRMLEEKYHPPRFGMPMNETLDPSKKEYYNPEKGDAVNLTFRQLYHKTGKRVKLKVTGTNITKQTTLEFSVDKTPDFPVVDAICISSSFPMAFKPTFVNAWVDMSKPAHHHDNLKYHGFYVDGGMLNNIPIHFFDKITVDEQGVRYHGPKGVLGIGLNGRIDGEDLYLGKDVPREISAPDFPEKILNSNAMDADLKKALEEELKKLKQAKKEVSGSRLLKNIYEAKHSKYQFYNYGNGAFGTRYIIEDGRITEMDVLIDYLGSLLGSFMYPMEHGQFRSKEERESHYIELFAYAIETLDFNPEKYHTQFVQKRAFQKMMHKMEFDRYLKKSSVLKEKFTAEELTYNSIMKDNFDGSEEYPGPFKHPYTK